MVNNLKRQKAPGPERTSNVVLQKAIHTMLVQTRRRWHPMREPRDVKYLELYLEKLQNAYQ